VSHGCAGLVLGQLLLLINTSQQRQLDTSAHNHQATHTNPSHLPASHPNHPQLALMAKALQLMALARRAPLAPMAKASLLVSPAHGALAITSTPALPAAAAAASVTPTAAPPRITRVVVAAWMGLVAVRLECVSSALQAPTARVWASLSPVSSALETWSSQRALAGASAARATPTGAPILNTLAATVSSAWGHSALQMGFGDDQEKLLQSTPAPNHLLTIRLPHHSLPPAAPPDCVDGYGGFKGTCMACGPGMYGKNLTDTQLCRVCSSTPQSYNDVWVATDCKTCPPDQQANTARTGCVAQPKVGCNGESSFPPSPCLTGTCGASSGASWVVCQADASTAWLSQSVKGYFNALAICKTLGYTTVS